MTPIDIKIMGGARNAKARRLDHVRGCMTTHDWVVRRHLTPAQRVVLMEGLSN